MEDNDFTPAPWAVADTFSAARSAYAASADRAYDDAVSKKKLPSEFVPDSIESDVEFPIVVLTDDTGSMGTWPAVIFTKLGYLDHEAKTYFGKNKYEIAFGAVGDCFSDSYPLQMRKFGSGEDLAKNLKELVNEGGGGGTDQESYDLGALYVARNCKVPNAIRPLLIFIGDEGIYPEVYPDKAEQFAKVKLKTNLPVGRLFKELTDKWDVYVIRKPYNCTGNTVSDADRKIQKQWEDLIGEDHVIQLPEAERVVDVIFGIFAKVTNKQDEFEKELKDRQLKDLDGKHKVDVVLKSLETIHKTTPKLPKSPKNASVTKRTKKAEKSSDSLLAE